jgi:hypothetical protein
MLEKIQRFILLTVGVLAMSLAIGYLVFAWVEPTAPPPGGNVPAPINVGSAEQWKSGKFGISTTNNDEPFVVKNNGYYFFVGANRGGGDYVDIGAYREGVGWKNLILNRDGGNVGIGTTSPGAKLNIYNTADALMKLQRSGTTDFYNLTMDTNGYLVLRDRLNNPVISIDTVWYNPTPTITRGAVGIGAMPNSSVQLYVNTGGYFTWAGYFTGTAVGIEARGSDRGGGFVNTNTNAGILLAWGNWGAYTDNDVHLGNNVIIGTAGSPSEFPSYKLDVNGALRLRPSSAPTGANGVIYYDSGTNKFRCYQNGAWTDCIGAGTGLPAGSAGQTLRHDGTNWVANSVLFNNGTYVGIGTSASENTLRFYGITGDNPGGYDHTVIAERQYGAVDESELLLFKGNDPVACVGCQDRIRIDTPGYICSKQEMVFVHIYRPGLIE